MTNDTWSPLLVIRPDAGSARLEDSQSNLAESVSPHSLAAQILSHSPALGTRVTSPDETLNHPQSDWVSHGWQPSLEYFDWSEKEGAAVGGADSLRPSDYTKNLRGSTVWDWSTSDVAASPAKTVGQVLMGRRTRRVFDASPLEQEIFASVLRGFAEVLDTESSTDGFLTGLDFASIVFAVDGLDAGVWDLDLVGRRAALRQGGNFRVPMSDLMCGMQAPMTAAATVVLTVDFDERQRRFPYERALRELYLEVGRIAQWLILVCESHGLGCLITPATNDKILSDVLGIPTTEAPIYTITFGRRKTTQQAPASK